MLALICAASQAQLMEQREQSQACLGYAEIPEQGSPTRSLSRQKKAESQINPKMQQLFDKLTGLGEAPNIIKSGGKNHPTRLDYSVYLYYSPNMYQDVDSLSLDSILREDKYNLNQCLSAIRQTFDSLQEVAAESYHYEYHKAGSDTIVYSMSLCQDNKRIPGKHYVESHPLFYSDEYLYFNYRPCQEENGVCANLQYVVNIHKPEPQTEKNSLELLTSDIARLFTQNKIKPRMAMWRHDKAYSDSIHAVNSEDFESRTVIGGNGLEGITNAQIYTVPLEQEDMARQLFDEISKMALQFTDGNLDVYYRYNYLTFDESYWGAILTCYYDETTTCSINMRRNESGFHFVIANTNGMEWFPAGWPGIKTFVNGKVSYFKGMEPKENE